MIPVLQRGDAARLRKSYELDEPALDRQQVAAALAASPAATVAVIPDHPVVLAPDVSPLGATVADMRPVTLPTGLLRLSSRAPGTSLGVRWYRFAKRASDIVLSIALLILTMPLMVGAALLVRVTSRGPVFYLQERFGLHGRRFKIIKFRSMVNGADQRVAEMAELAKVTGLMTTGAPAFKSADDPRITRAGRILRRTNLDELPQLFNVLAGHMSLVGPRPLVPAEALCLTPDEAKRRHSIRPGLTCLWQVLREEGTTFSERIQLDLFYVAHASLTLDVALMAMTPRAVVGGNGSY